MEAKEAKRRREKRGRESEAKRKGKKINKGKNDGCKESSKRVGDLG